MPLTMHVRSSPPPVQIVAGVNGAIVTSLQSVVSQRKASCATLAANIKAGMAGMGQGTQ